MSQSQMQQHADGLREAQVNLDNFTILKNTREATLRVATAKLLEARIEVEQAQQDLDEARIGQQSAMSLVSSRLQRMRVLCGQADPLYITKGYTPEEACMDARAENYRR